MKEAVFRTSHDEIRRCADAGVPVQTLAEMQKMAQDAAQLYFLQVPGKRALIEAEIKRLDEFYWSIPSYGRLQHSHWRDDELVDHMNYLSDLEDHIENLEKRRDELYTFMFTATPRMMNAFFLHWHLAFIAAKHEQLHFERGSFRVPPVLSLILDSDQPATPPPTEKFFSSG